MSQQIVSRERAPSDSGGEALGPPRFSLRTLMVAMTGLCCLFALMAAVGALWSLALLFVMCLVVAHVVGNSLGTKLRDRSPTVLASHSSESHPGATRAPATHPVVQPPHLSQRARLSRVTILMTVGGAAAGSYLGAVGSAGTYPEAGNSAVVLGTVSAAVLGAMAGFMASSFTLVVRQAWREALAHGESGRTSGR